MRYAHIDEDNKIIGWYDSEIHKEIPTPNVEANNDVWQNAINNNHNKINNDGTTELFDFRTDEEIAQSLIDDKWTEYSVFENNLTIDIIIDENTTHTYNASPSSLLTIERKAVSAYTTEVKEILWVENNDSFMTTKVELEMVILKADKLLQNKIIELFGE